jgi:hypothetical protein
MANQCNINGCSYGNCNGQTSFENNEKYSSKMSNDAIDQPYGMICQRPNSIQYQQQTSNEPTTSCMGRYVNTGQMVHPVQNFVSTHAYSQAPQQGVLMHQKSWDNIPGSKQQTHTSKVTHIFPPALPAKHNYDRYANYDANNCNLMPHQFVKEATYTKTTIITTKSTDNLIPNAHYGNVMNESCKCIVQTKQIIAPNCVACNNPGYYSNIKKNASSSSKRYVPTKTEITRL